MNTTCSLSNKHCVPCEGGVLPLSKQEYTPLLSELNGWHVIEEKKLIKQVTGKNFKDIIATVDAIADIAEGEGHHPDLSIHDWNKLDITLSTHTIGGLSENDFILAAKIDEIV